MTQKKMELTRSIHQETAEMYENKRLHSEK